MLRCIQRYAIICVFYRPTLHRVSHQPKHRLSVDVQILVNQFPTFWRILVDRFPFVLGISALNISNRNYWPSMQKSQLTAFSVLFFDIALFQFTFACQVIPQTIVHLLFDPISQLSKVLRNSRCNAVILVYSCHHSIVGHQLHELSLIICRVFQLFHFFRELLLNLLVRFVAQMRFYNVLIAALLHFQLKTKEF